MDVSTHLGMIKSEMYDGAWERFYVRRPARLIAVSPGLVGLTTRSCEVIDISRGGASLTVNTTIGLPTHYYLEITGLTARIGCAEVHRRHGRVAVKFIMPLPEKTLHRVVRAEFLLGGKP
jgi:hypothetical protein